MGNKKSGIEAWVAIAILGLLVVAIAIIHTQSLSIGIGNVATYRFVYLNTYDYPNLSQQPSTVSWSYTANHNLGTTTGVCNTNIELFNLEEYVIELDAPTASYVYPISQKYAAPGSQGVNIAVCEITLPASYYNTTQGTLTVDATGNNGWTSATYTATIQIESEYLAQESGQPSPTIITIPLTNPTPATTTQPTTTTMPTTTSTVAPTTATQPTTTQPTTTQPTTTQATQTPTTPQTTPQINIFQQIANFLNGIWQAIANAFSI